MEKIFWLFEKFLSRWKNEHRIFSWDCLISGTPRIAQNFKLLDIGYSYSTVMWPEIYHTPDHCLKIKYVIDVKLLGYVLSRPHKNYRKLQVHNCNSFDRAVFSIYGHVTFTCGLWFIGLRPRNKSTNKDPGGLDYQSLLISQCYR